MRHLLFALALICLLPACHRTVDHGLGSCREYTPSCSYGTLVCEHDDRGCRICTCVDRTRTPDHGPVNPHGPP